MKGTKNIESIASDCLLRTGQAREMRMAALKRADRPKYDEALTSMAYQVIFSAIMEIAEQKNKVDDMREETALLMKLGGVQECAT